MRNLFRSKLLIIILGFLLQHNSYAQSNWSNPFNEKEIKNWRKIGGKSNFTVSNHVITGEVKRNTPATYLVTKKRYRDFILEFEVYFDTLVNSGVLIRSNIEKDEQKGLYGYQIEIDPASLGYSGGIYEQNRRGWLYPLSRNNQARSAIKIAQWNKYHIEAIGNTINTWVNGIHCARLVDDRVTEGLIGLQIPDISNNPDLEGAQIKWKNIKILTSDFGMNQWNKSLTVPEISYLPNELTNWEKRNGFRLLWDGKSTKGWKGMKSDEFPDKRWKIENGELKVLPENPDPSITYSDIVTIDKFRNFELELEFKITKGANSGIKYFVNRLPNGDLIGCEYQIIDDKEIPNSKIGVNGTHKLGSLYALVPPENIFVKEKKELFKGVDTWNKVRILSVNGKVEHWLNNEKIVEYNRFSQLFSALIAYSKYNKFKSFGQSQEGNILLQDYENEVSFRSIKIRELN